MSRKLLVLRRLGIATASFVLIIVVGFQPAFSQAGVGSVISAEPPFTAGTFNIVTFDPSAIPGADVYEVCFFDSANLITHACIDLSAGKSLGSGVTLDVVFEDLDNGSKYGYYVQAHFIVADSVVYSDTTFSIQDATPPEQINDATIDNQPGGIVVIEWTGVDDLVSSVDQYDIYRKLAGQAYNQIASVTAGPPDSVHTFSDSVGGSTDLVEGASQLYQIRAVDVVGNGSNSSNLGPVNPDSTKPDIPTLTIENAYYDVDSVRYVAGVRSPVTARSNGTGPARADSIQFEWARDDTARFTSQVVLGWDYDSSDWMRYTSDSLFWDTTLLPHPDSTDFVHNHFYIFRASAKDTTNNISDPSDTAGVYMDAYPPSDITNLTAAPKDDPVGVACIVEVKWEAATDFPSGVAKYFIDRSINGDDYVPIGEVGGADTLFEDYCVGLDHRQWVWYKVYSEDNVGNRRYSTVWVDSTKPPMPPKIESTCDDTTAAGLCYVVNYTVLTWPEYDTSGVIKYTVDVNGVQEELLGPGHFFDTSWFDVDTVYTLRVRSHFGDGNVSIWSQAEIVRRDHSAPNPITDLEALEDTTCAGDIELNWSTPQDSQGVSSVVRYNIFRMKPGDTGYVLIDSTLAGDPAYENNGAGYFDEYAVPDYDTLVAFQRYSYKVQPADLLDNKADITQLIPDTAYCSRPPEIDSAETGSDFIRIHWHRASPNAASTWYDSVRVYKNSWDNSYTSFEVHGSEPYPLQSVISGLTVADFGNYIFQVKEMPTDPELDSMSSAWSCPFVVPWDNLPDSVTSLVVQPQPILPEDTPTNAARIFLSWHYDDSLLADSFAVIRRTDGQPDVLATIVSTGSADISYMDIGLWSETEYIYGVYVYDSLGQVSSTVWGTTSVDPIWMFTPAVLPFEPIYFNNDTLVVEWQWLDAAMSPAADNPYGAHSCQVQVSTNSNFDQGQPDIIGAWVDAGPGSTTFGGLNSLASQITWTLDKRLYFRVRAQDRWGNVSPWSTEYDFDLIEAHFDDRAPNSCTSLLIDSTKAHPSPSDRDINVFLNWDAVLDNGLAGVMSYIVYRANPGGGTDTLATIGYPDTKYMDDSVDVDGVGNCGYSYWIQTVDSLGNEQESGNNIACLDVLSAPVIDAESVTDSGFCWTNPDEVDADYYYAVAVLDSSWFGTPIEDSLGQTAWITGDTYCWAFQSQFGGDVNIFYRVKQIRDLLESNWSDVVTYFPPNDVDDPGGVDELPREFALYPNYPNPFNPETQIVFDLPRRVNVSLRIYNIKGELVRILVDGSTVAGHHSVVWRGDNRAGQSVASGVYIYQIKADEKTMSRKMVLLR